MQEGRDKFAHFAEDGALNENLREDVVDILDLKPGWSDDFSVFPGGSGDIIPDEAFGFAADLLDECKSRGKLPTDLIPSPLQTIDFHFSNGCTLIVDGELATSKMVDVVSGVQGHPPREDWKVALEKFV
jgi:hypothetical protein